MAEIYHHAGRSSSSRVHHAMLMWYLTVLNIAIVSIYIYICIYRFNGNHIRYALNLRKTRKYDIIPLCAHFAPTIRPSYLTPLQPVTVHLSLPQYPLEVWQLISRSRRRGSRCSEHAFKNEVTKTFPTDYSRMRLLKYAILHRIFVPFWPKQVPFWPNISCSIWDYVLR